MTLELSVEQRERAEILAARRVQALTALQRVQEVLALLLEPLKAEEREASNEFRGYLQSLAPHAIGLELDALDRPTGRLICEEKTT